MYRKKWRSYISARILIEVICGHLDYELFPNVCYVYLL